MGLSPHAILCNAFFSSSLSLAKAISSIPYEFFYAFSISLKTLSADSYENTTNLLLPKVHLFFYYFLFLQLTYLFLCLHPLSSQPLNLTLLFLSFCEALYFPQTSLCLFIYSQILSKCPLPLSLYTFCLFMSSFFFILLAFHDY